MAQNNRSSAHHSAIWLLHVLSKNTTKIYGHKISEILYPSCFAYFQGHKLSLPTLGKMTYYACRLCGQSREYLAISNEGVIVLDNQMTAKYRYQDNVIQINWIRLGSLFDFHHIFLQMEEDSTASYK